METAKFFVEKLMEIVEIVAELGLMAIFFVDKEWGGLRSLRSIKVTKELKELKELREHKELKRGETRRPQELEACGRCFAPDA